MEVIHSVRAIEVRTEDFITLIYNFLKGSCKWYATDDTNKILYVADKIYIQLVANTDKTFSVYLMDTNPGADWVERRSFYYTSDYYANATVYKVNDDCFGIAFNSGTSGVTYYNSCSIFIDSYTDDDGNKSKMAVVIWDKYRYIADGKTRNREIYSTYMNSIYQESYNSEYPTTQIIPFVSPFGGEKADNLYTVVLTNQNSNNIVTLNDEKWFLTNTFALPCGNSITKRYYEGES